MKYETPALVAVTSAINAIQGPSTQRPKAHMPWYSDGQPINNEYIGGYVAGKTKAVYSLAGNTRKSNLTPPPLLSSFSSGGT